MKACIAANFQDLLVTLLALKKWMFLEYPIKITGFFS